MLWPYHYMFLDELDKGMTGVENACSKKAFSGEPKENLMDKTPTANDSTKDVVLHCDTLGECERLAFYEDGNMCVEEQRNTSIDDSGKRISYGENAAVREPTTGKGRFDLISPFALDRLAHWYELGAGKYAPRNWEKGIPWSRCLDSALRHLNKFERGMTDEDHLAAAAWNIFAIIHYQELGMTEFNDIPNYNKEDKK